MTMRPLVVIVPSKRPSMRKSPFETISPLKAVPFDILFRSDSAELFSPFLLLLIIRKCILSKMLGFKVKDFLPKKFAAVKLNPC